MDNQRNLLLALVLSALLLFGWDFVMRTYYPEPAPSEVAAQPDSPSDMAASATPGGSDGTSEASIERDLDTALASADRIAIDAPEVVGSLNPVGARVDDIELKTHRQTVEKDSGPVQLLAPLGTPLQHFARFDWVGEGVALPDANTVWKKIDGDTLTQTTPVTLGWDNGAGLTFGLRFAIDDKYMITVTQSVKNGTESAVALRPRAIINRTSTNASHDMWVVQSGPVAAINEKLDFGTNYDDVAEDGTVRLEGRPDWLGFTDIYWMSALIPDENAASGSFTNAGQDKFAAVLLYDAANVAAGETLTRTTRLFAGAKESATLDAYESAGVTKFGRAIDWGTFGFIVWPFWQVLIFLFGLTKNFGVAIICLTLIVRLVMFPIANKQFASMAQMRAVQPKMKALQERYKDDKAQLQQEMAKLYKEEKVNPLAGCLPIFLQIPIFFALYKTLLLTIEMRHQPFVAWIRDLSAPDPANLHNLLVTMGINPPGFLSIVLALSVMAVLLGITMWLQFKLNPSTMEPTQQQIFMIMPWVLMFVMAPFAAGLLLYWITSNILTLGQQKLLYARHPQLKAQIEKDREDKARAAEREKVKG